MYKKYYLEMYSLKVEVTVCIFDIYIMEVADTLIK